ncbi:hypothetical protein AAJP47_12715 [Psychrobacter sp. B38]|uniref:hypothetical protein n=1 Tax=Psychrobacter sp. B38 TaxID=3143538 RepID=UPI00320EBA8F
MIDGIWWLVILFAVIVVLWLLAKSRGIKSGDASHRGQSKTPTNDSLQKTLALLKQHFPDYRVTRKTNHLLLSQQDKKIAMITIDKKIATGQRRLGNVPVINYHYVPSHAQLSELLKNPT